MRNNVDYETSNSIRFRDLPSTWKVKRFKYLTQVRKEVSTTGDEELLSVTEVRGIVKRRELKSNDDSLSRAEDLTGYRHVKKGDLVSNIMLVWKRGLGVSPYNGIVSPAYSVFTFSDECYPDYYNYLVRSDEYITEFRKHSTGITMSRLRLYDDSFGTVFAHLPPFEEQKLISRYLDKKTEQIDCLVEKIQRKIELLKEQRTTLINQCVTKGLDPNVEMKDSGVEWIGDIPKHWDVTKLKYHGSVLIGLSFDKDDIVDENEGTLVLRSSNVQNGVVSFSNNIWVKSKVPENLFVQTGDILICSRNGSRNLIGKNCLLGKESLGMTWGVFMSVFRTKHPNFFHWMLNSQVFKSQSGLYLTSTINQLTVSTLENLKFPFVADPIEQQKIHDFLSREIDLFDKLIKKENDRIILLKEYRQSLISSVVTGKVRVMENML